jgi:hypothetical protein
MNLKEAREKGKMEQLQSIDVRIADNLFMDAVIYGPVASEVEFNALRWQRRRI